MVQLTIQSKIQYHLREKQSIHFHNTKGATYKHQGRIRIKKEQRIKKVVGSEHSLTCLGLISVEKFNSIFQFQGTPSIRCDCPILLCPQSVSIPLTRPVLSSLFTSVLQWPTIYSDFFSFYRMSLPFEVYDSYHPKKQQFFSVIYFLIPFIQ